MKLLQMILIFCLILFFPLAGQVNTEAMRSDDEIIGFHQKLHISFAYISGNSEFIILNSNYRIDYRSKTSWHGFFITKYDRAFEKSQDDFENRGLGHVRFINLIQPKIYIEGFLQKEFNHFLDLQNRELIGGGFRFNPFNQFFFGIGAMNEIEEYEYFQEQNFVKSTNYINYTVNPFEGVAIQNILYYQFQTDDISHYRILWDGQLSLQGSDWLSFHINFKYRYDMSNLNPSGDSYFELTNGFEFRF